MVGLDEKTASIAEDLRTQLPDSRERRFKSLQAGQPLIESKSRSGRRDISRDPLGHPLPASTARASVERFWPGLGDGVKSRITILIVFFVVGAVAAPADSLDPIRVP